MACALIVCPRSVLCLSRSQTFLPRLAKTLTTFGKIFVRRSVTYLSRLRRDSVGADF